MVVWWIKKKKKNKRFGSENRWVFRMKNHPSPHRRQHVFLVTGFHQMINSLVFVDEEKRCHIMPPGYIIVFGF